MGRSRRRTQRAPSGYRPTLGKVREALFDIIGHQLDGCEVLDLYAGSGALGRMALERGAASATFIERDRTLCRRLATELVGYDSQAKILMGPAAQKLAVLQQEGHHFDLVLADPPYALDPTEACLEPISRHQLLREDGRLVVETAARTRTPLRLRSLIRYDQRTYGSCTLHFYSHQLRASP